MSLQALSDYTIVSRYSRYLPKLKRRETWEEMITRVFDMHAIKYKHALDTDKHFRTEFEFAKEMVLKKRVLGAQRILQFGGDAIFKHQAKVFNCAYGYLDRIKAFSETMYLLLCGCGVGFSVQTKHIDKLPGISWRIKREKTFIPDDSIEGWSDCVKVLIESFTDPTSEWYGHIVEWDMSNIRPEGALIAGQFKAPGPDGLFKALNNARDVIERRLANGSTRLHPIDAYDIIMHLSDAVLSGGVRRSATICLFSKSDKEMMTAKTGDWFIKNPQRGRSNNSVLLVRNEVTKKEFAEILESTKKFGEPGFVFSDSEDIGFNPCVEIGLYPQTEDGRSGWQFCNLCEINGKYCDTKEKFLECCRAASFIGTLQAGYTDFKYLSKETEEITKREALLGCSITGIMDNPEVLLDPDVQKRGANVIKKVNDATARAIGINMAARTTCIKPAGSTSCVLSTSSGIHPHHARRYIRRVQANRNEFPVQHFKKINPLAVEKSVWSANGTDEVISFLCDIPRNAITKNTMSAVELLEVVKKTQQNWVEHGTNENACMVKGLRHNVSNTITVKPEEWDDIEKFIYDNRKWFAGISLLPASGDLDYPQAPFTSVLTDKEIVDEYGNGALLASGLVVDGLAAYDNNLWAACDSLNGIGQVVTAFDKPIEPVKPARKDYTSEKLFSQALIDHSTQLVEFYKVKGEWIMTNLKLDWLRRARQFAKRYFDGDEKKMCHCLKHVYNFKQWLDLKREYKEVDWNEAQEDSETFTSADTLAAQACAGGQCELR